VLTQILVKRALASMPDASPPDTLFDKIARRLDAESASTTVATRRIRPPQKKTTRHVV
jgi:hypothetical protein